MDLRSTDLRFLLPRPPTSVALLGAAAGSREAWAAAGVPVVDSGADVVVGTAAEILAALSSRPEMLLLSGRVPPRRLAAAGYRSAHVLALPTPSAPRLLVPLASRAALTAALASVGRRPHTPATAVRALALALLHCGVAPARALVTVAARQVPVPWLLERASRVPSTVEQPWFLWLGGGDQLQRAVLHRVESGGGQVVKFSRVALNSLPFEREQAAARAAAKLPEGAARHVPGLLGHGTDGGLPYVVERRFGGRMLNEVLVSRWPRARRLEYVERVAAWLHDVAAATVSSPAALASERERLAREVVPAWTSHGASVDTVSLTDGVPGVLAHNDVGSWNIVADRDGGFGVVDWESARDPGMPLWDLTYFLADALTLVEHARLEDRTAAILQLFRGGSPLSALLFAHVRQAVDRLGIDPDVVGALVTLGWLHHGLSPALRLAKLRTIAGGGRPGQGGPLSLLAERWLRDPRLGVTWQAWR